MCSEYTTAESKVCSKCGVSQPLDNYNRDRSHSDGRCSSCKPCRAEYGLTDRRRKYQHEYNRRPEVMERHNELKRSDKYKEQRRKNYLRPSVRARAAAARSTSSALKSHRLRQVGYRLVHPVETQARKLVNGVVASGKLPRADTCDCFVCGCVAQEYHHVDYSQPLEVVPLCARCHKDVHRCD